MIVNVVKRRTNTVVEALIHAAVRAERIRADSAALVAAGGFAEYFDPFTGEGLGGGSFSWTAATWLDWARSGAHRPGDPLEPDSAHVT